MDYLLVFAGALVLEVLTVIYLRAVSKDNAWAACAFTIIHSTVAYLVLMNIVDNHTAIPAGVIGEALGTLIGMRLKRKM